MLCGTDHFQSLMWRTLGLAISPPAFERLQSCMRHTMDQIDSIHCAGDTWWPADIYLQWPMLVASIVLLDWAFAERPALCQSSASHHTETFNMFRHLALSTVLIQSPKFVYHGTIYSLYNPQWLQAFAHFLKIAFRHVQSSRNGHCLRKWSLG